MNGENRTGGTSRRKGSLLSPNSKKKGTCQAIINSTGGEKKREGPLILSDLPETPREKKKRAYHPTEGKKLLCFVSIPARGERGRREQLIRDFLKKPFPVIYPFIKVYVLKSPF